jgi:hypothetical protein
MVEAGSNLRSSTHTALLRGAVVRVLESACSRLERVMIGAATIYSSS